MPTLGSKQTFKAGYQPAEIARVEPLTVVDVVDTGRLRPLINRGVHCSMPVA